MREERELKDITVEEIRTVSRSLQKNKFTVKYWHDEALKLQDSLGLDVIDARSLVQVAIQCKPHFKEIVGFINFGIQNADDTKERMQD